MNNLNEMKQEKNTGSNDREVPVLFAHKADCCGCEACVNVCPRGAISMVEDECGFRYPRIDASLCIRCGKCKKVCTFQNREETNRPLEAYAARAKDGSLIRKSSSGGVFAAVAREVLENGGVVFGAAFDSDWSVRHIMVDTVDDLHKLQGSKYTQSAAADAYRRAKRALEEGKTVLYSGTPCQIAGLYGFLGGDAENLVTMDLICHGVPNDRMLREYLNHCEAGAGGEIKNFTFRDKSLGWGINGSIFYQKNGKIRKKILWKSESSYIYYFLNGWIYRENCYQCKYACANRPADITIGDYWGIESAHPEYLSGGWNAQEGISAVVVNTEKGRVFLERFGAALDLKPSTFEKVQAGNHNLNEPTKPGKREEILAVYRQGGWEAVEARFKKKMGLRYYTEKLKHMVPQSVKRSIKKLLKK